MEFRENLITLRKSRGWSQEELGFRIDVSRQTVSKWESGDTTPEMGRLIALSDIFGVTIDQLVSGENRKTEVSPDTGRSSGYEYISSRTVYGIPLVHINIGRGFRKAKGVVAIGNLALGIVSVGGISLGVISVGALSAGIIAMASMALGVFSFGALALGVIAAGGIASGYLAMGGIATGIYSIGGVSTARDIAIGGVANGYIAIGESVNGTIEFITDSDFSNIDKEEIKSAIRHAFPNIKPWIADLFTGFFD